MSDETDKIIKDIEDNGIGFVDLLFTGLMGELKCVTVMAEEMPAVFDADKGVDGSSLLGFARLEESDQLLVADPASYRKYPFSESEPEERTACIFCNIHNPDRSLFQDSPRSVLQRMVKEAEAAGFDSFACAPELEFFLFQPDTEGKLAPLPYDQGGYFDCGTHDPADSLKKKMMIALGKMGIKGEYAHHEVAPGQHELDIRYGPALETADKTMLFKQIIKTVAHQGGAHATFMPKPLNGQNGSGMHTHFSLWKDGKNTFYDPEGSPYHMSATGRHFIGGLLEHVRDITAILNPTVNSYKRLIPGYEAPVYVSWASINRSALVRVPAVKPEKEPTGRRAEIRSPDPSANPYLAFAMILAAGLDGIKRGLEPGEPVDGVNLFNLSSSELADRGINHLPGSLEDALKDLQRSSWARSVMGDSLHDTYLEAKWKEWDLFREAVTNWELDTYLPVL